MHVGGDNIILHPIVAFNFTKHCYISKYMRPKQDCIYALLSS